jgi:hypothetical protein
VPSPARTLPFVGLIVVGQACTTTDESTPLSCHDVELLVAAGSLSVSSGPAALCTAPGNCIFGAELGSDPVLSATNGRVFFVARDRDRVIELDPACGTPMHVVPLDALAPRDSLGKTSTANPHDVAAAKDGTLLAPLYYTPKLAFLKDGQIESIDLSTYDSDGNPEADAVSVVDVGGTEKAFVTLERLTVEYRGNAVAFASKQPSQMLRVDVATRKAEAVIDLAGRNPFNPMAELDGALFLAEPGDFDSATDDAAGIERFDTATSTTRLLVTEKDLGASVVQVAVTKGCGVAIVAGPQPTFNPTSVITFDPESGQILTTLAAPLLGPTTRYDLYGLTWRGDKLYVGDRRRGANGYPIHVFQRTDRCTLTSVPGTIDLTQAPIALRPAR